MKDVTWNDVKWFLQKQSYEISSPYNTGFNTWPLKQKLYDLKDQLDEILEDCPTYAGETEWLQERAVEKSFKKLSK